MFIDAALDRANRIVDLGVVVLGSRGQRQLRDQRLARQRQGRSAPRARRAGEGCAAIEATHVRCDVGAYLATHAAPRHAVPLRRSAWGDAGDDTIQLFGDFPREFEAHASGGDGNDHLIGGDEQDVFFTGADGEDGSRATTATTRCSARATTRRRVGRRQAPRGRRQYHDGADILDGGAGNDQLVADYVCGGHRYIGGPGHDIAGFARSGKHAIYAQLGGPSKRTKTQW